MLRNEARGTKFPFDCNQQKLGYRCNAPREADGGIMRSMKPEHLPEEQRKILRGGANLSEDKAGGKAPG